MYFFAANVEGASFELYDCGSHLCQLMEYRHRQKHEQRTALDLAMKLHSGTGISAFLCDLLRVRNNEVTEKKLVNALSYTKRKKAGPPVHSTADFRETVSSCFLLLMLDVGLD
uniref:Uncharacterized protein n=1 Tax=Plectus sambesii TaxID=2011161 RepID=A0A914UMS2_9BILA